MEDQSAEVVQPEGGQGDGGASEAPYAEFLNRVPEDYREQVEPVFRDWDSNVTRRFQEASEYKKSWEPYEQFGDNQLSPEEVQWALQFRNAAVENPTAIKDWYSEYAQQHGLVDQQTQSQQQPAQEPFQQPADEFGYTDPSEQFKQMLQEQLGPLQQQIEHISEWRQSQEQQVREEAAQRAIDSRMSELEQQHGDQFNRDAVETFAQKYAVPGADPVEVVNRGWQDFQSLVGQIQTSTLQGKVDAPAPAESGGVVNAAPEKITSLDQAAALALEQLRGNRG